MIVPAWGHIALRMGGRHALSLRIFLLGVPFWVLGFTLNEDSSFRSAASFFLVFSAACLGQAAMGIVLWLGYLGSTRARAAGAVPLSFLIPIWSLSAVARILVIVVFLEFVGIPNDLPLTTRIVTSILIASVGYALASFALDAYDRFRDERARILDGVLRSEEQLSAHRLTVSAMKKTLVDQVDQKLEESRESSRRALDDLELALSTSADSRPALDDLRSLSDKTWQRISEDVWVAAPHNAPKVRGPELLSVWAGSGPFRPAMLALVSFFLYALIYSRAFDPIIGAVATIAWLGGAVVLTTGLNWMLARVTRLVLPLLWASVLLVVFSAIPVLVVLGFFDFAADAPLRVVGSHAVSLCMMLATSIPPTVARAHTEILEGLRARLDSATMEKLHVESQLAITAKKLASQLHGDVRGNFMSGVLNLQRHIDEGNTLGALETMAQLRALLTEPLGADITPENPAETLKAFVQNWAPILDISFDNPIDDVPAEFLPAFHTVVVDAINNAVRHGQADWVRIGFSAERDSLQLNIRNNGKSRASTRTGLGTVHLNQLAPEKWSRFVNEQGIIQLVVSLERHNLGSLIAGD